MFTCFITYQKKQKQKQTHTTFFILFFFKQTWKVSLVKLFCRASTWPDRRRAGVMAFFTYWSSVESKVNCHRKQEASPEDHAAWRSSLEGRTPLPSFTAQPQTAPGHECISVFMGLPFLCWTHMSWSLCVYVCVCLCLSLSGKGALTRLCVINILTVHDEPWWKVIIIHGIIIEWWHEAIHCTFLFSEE